MAQQQQAAAVGASLQKEILKATEMLEHQVDAEIDKLDKLDEDDIEVLRRKRMDAMKKQASQRQEWLSLGHGEYTEITDEKEFFTASTTSKAVVCHFYRDGFFRCSIIDKHLSLLAPRHLECRFVKMNAERSPFLTQRLHIRVLPTLAIVRDQQTVDYVVGFDDLGGKDDFTTEVLEWRIARAGVISYSGDLQAPPDSVTSTSSKSSTSSNFITRVSKGKQRKGKHAAGVGGGDDSDTDSD